MNILLGGTGSVASIKYLKLFDALQEVGNVKGILTQKALHFLQRREVPNKDRTLYTDNDEWHWKEIGDPVIHIDLKEWADIFVIAPLSANTLAKIANGLCDNLLTSVYRAWPTNKPIIIAPAMNTDMWYHPITQEHLKTFARHNPVSNIINPVSGNLACGTEGVGAMAPISSIVECVKIRVSY